MGELLRTVFPKNFERVQSNLQYRESSLEDKQELTVRLIRSIDYSKLLTKEQHVGLIGKSAMTLRQAEDNEGNIIHSLRVTDLLLAPTKRGRMLESPYLSQELSYMATSIEAQAAIWGLGRTGIGEEYKKSFARVDYYANGFARPFTDFGRWIGGKAKIDKWELTNALLKEGFILAGSSFLFYSANTLDTPDPLSKAIQLGAVGISGIGYGAATHISWEGLRDNMTHSRGEQFYLVTTSIKLGEE